MALIRCMWFEVNKMQQRLINANKIKCRTVGAGGWNQPENVVSDYEIEKMPTVDAVEVVHGWWKPELMPTGVEYTGWAEMTVQAMRCSECGRLIDVGEGYFTYCPNCGAKMDGDGDGQRTW